MGAGRLITIEGLDGVGKTTLARALVEELRGRGIDAALLREPGGVRAAERVRELVTDPGLRVDPRAEALLYAAARAQLVQEAVAPRLRTDRWVLLDRFVDSSLAYQGGGRGLGVSAVRAINDFATGDLTPDRTLWLVLDPAQAAARSRARGTPADRIEQERSDFFTRVDAAYTDLWRRDPVRIRRLDAAQPPEALLSAAVAELSDLL